MIVGVGALAEHEIHVGKAMLDHDVPGTAGYGIVEQTMNISLPEQLKEHVDAQVESGRYTSVSEYVRELVRLDLKTRERERIEQAVLAGINSGEPIEMTPQAWEQLRQDVFAQKNPG